LTEKSSKDPVSSIINGGKYKTHLQVSKYTVLIACIFIVQIAFCFGIVSYVNNKVKAAEMRNEK
jgi:hypothetical protein